MDIKWKKYRYGTEDKNPAWSFFGSVLCPVGTLIALALAKCRGSGICLVTSLWFLVFSVISWIHLGRMMKNEKKNLLPVGILDNTCPDLVFFILFCILLFNLDSGWWGYGYMVHNIFCFAWNPIVLLYRFFFFFFMTGTIILFMVVLYMSIMRHLSREKLRKKLFLFKIKVLLKNRREQFSSHWEAYRTFQAEKGEAFRTFRNRQLWLLCGQGLLFFLLYFYMEAVYYDIEAAMMILMLVGSICFLLDLLFILRTSKEVEILLSEINQIAEDRQVWEEPVLKPHSIFRGTEQLLLDIRENKKESMEKRIQSERMKVDLITNVSHDLKTPLTSMIGCIDLLKQVEGLPQEAKDYVELLSVKAGRLREMIQDVFEMAKATSGGQDLKLERLDMARLIRQTMADMQDRIDKSGLCFRLKIEEKELPFLGDSKKMYRVYQNLIENTLKYSMAGSRVYVEVMEQDEEIRTSIKNTSDHEMDFSAEEIMERFTRGDKSRSTEGNGLGLAIARSFTEACGGRMQVVLDGDLFRVDTVFDRTEEKPL